MNRIFCILIIGDTVLAALSHVLASVIFAWLFPDQLPAGFANGIIYITVLILCCYFSEIHRYDSIRKKREILFRSASAIIATFISLSTVFYLFPVLASDKRMLAISLLLFGGGQFIWHVWLKMFLRMSGLVPRIAVLGTGIQAKKLGDLIIERNRSHVFAGYIRTAEEKETARAVESERILGACDELHTVAKTNKIAMIVISLRDRRGKLPVGELLKCKFDGIQVVDSITYYERVTGKLMVERINPGWLIFSDGFRITWMKSLMNEIKYLVDFLIALTGIVLVSPILPVIYVAIRLTSSGPALYKQLRVGKGEKIFVIYKFRTMCSNAEEKSGAVWAQSDDSRITSLGHFLRKTRLDELPQLFNVLKGDMSFSGPRPERPEFVDILKKEIPYYSKRHAIKPGITGWAQINYPYGASVEDAKEKLMYDLYYIKNHSIFLDFLIVLETVNVVFARRGAR